MVDFNNSYNNLLIVINCVQIYSITIIKFFFIKVVFIQNHSCLLGVFVHEAYTCSKLVGRSNGICVIPFHNFM